MDGRKTKQKNGGEDQENIRDGEEEEEDSQRGFLLQNDVNDKNNVSEDPNESYGGEQKSWDPEIKYVVIILSIWLGVVDILLGVAEEDVELVQEAAVEAVVPQQFVVDVEVVVDVGVSVIVIIRVEHLV